MNFRKMITLIEMLALTGVMSVGFSTWVIVETSFPEIQIQVETENVFNTNEYLEIKNIVLSDYNENGFYPDFIYTDAQDKTKAKLFVDYYVNLEKYRQLTGSTSLTSLDFSFTITPPSYMLVTDYEWISNVCTAKYTFNDTTKETNLTYNNKFWVDNLVIEYNSVSSLNNFVISAAYTLNVIDFTTLYNYTQNASFKGFSFSIVASMGGN